MARLRVDDVAETIEVDTPGYREGDKRQPRAEEERPEPGDSGKPAPGGQEQPDNHADGGKAAHQVAHITFVPVDLGHRNLGEATEGEGEATQQIHACPPP